jgi:hypothetical protein
LTALAHPTEPGARGLLWLRLVRFRRRWVLVGLALVLVGMSVWPAPPLVRAIDRPCPDGQHVEQPVAVRLTPTLLEHQSWVGVPVQEVSSGMLLFACTDGVVVGSSTVDVDDVEQAVVTVGVPTRWVISHWLAGDLESMRAADRWRIVFTSHS